MNLVDLVIVLVLCAAAFHGFRTGLVTQVLALGAAAFGLYVGALVAPPLVGSMEAGDEKALLTLVILFVPPVVFSGLVGFLAAPLVRALRRLYLSQLDATLGLLASVVAVLFGAWVAGNVLAASSSQDLSASIQASTILKALDDRLPPAPSVFARLQQFINASGFPRAFAQLEPGVGEPVNLPADPSVRAAATAAAASTVKIEGFGCGGELVGSGFIAAPGLVITNAHVVAGIGEPVVIDRDGRHDAVPILFDPDLDIAVLRTEPLSAPPLPLLREAVERGTGDAVLGYPGGGKLDVEPSAVQAEVTATGRDIYGEDLVEREVYQLHTLVRPGNSGGPFVRSDGTVLGVVFSRSTSEPNIGYAVTSEEVAPLVDQAQTRRRAVATGDCAV